jgi:hypothetical protein
VVKYSFDSLRANENRNRSLFFCRVVLRRAICEDLKFILLFQKGTITMKKQLTKMIKMTKITKKIVAKKPMLSRTTKAKRGGGDKM